jgi:hypothetical protein
MNIRSASGHTSLAQSCLKSPLPPNNVRYLYTVTTNNVYGPSQKARRMYTNFSWRRIEKNAVTLEKFYDASRKSKVVNDATVILFKLTYDPRANTNRYTTRARLSADWQKALSRTYLMKARRYCSFLLGLMKNNRIPPSYAMSLYVYTTAMQTRAFFIFLYSA